MLSATKEMSSRLKEKKELAVGTHLRTGSKGLSDNVALNGSLKDEETEWGKSSLQSEQQSQRSRRGRKEHSML